MTKPTLPTGYHELPEEERDTALVIWAAEMEAAVKAREGDDFHVIAEHLLYLQVCTTLDDEAATARANTVPSGTSHGWVLCAGEGRAPVRCADHPETHRHLLFEC